MLDDLKWIHEKDPEDSLGIAHRQCSQLTHEFNLPPTDLGQAANIVFAGMGGSALPALYPTTWPGVTKPYEIVRGYDIPPYIGADTLFIACSYSGNTEETLSALAQAEERGARIAIIAAGGKLAEAAKEKGYLFAEVPRAEQPRYAVFAMFRALLDILDMAAVLAAGNNYKSELASAAAHTTKAIEAWLPEVATAGNPAKQLAQELMGKSLVMYAGPKLFPAAYKWKIGCNENAKQVAWCSQIPEFNHNEFIGWSSHPIDKPYAVVDLRSNLEHPRVQKRFEVTERLLSGLRPAPHVVTVQGDTLLEQLLWALAYGDFVTLYLAFLNGVDPAPVGLVEKFKKELNA
ncbi:MAG TPA: bifunctional phosphoglucose/phosphomannose isomerase [Candidatus Saccharimonadales bacterium]|nr:bifunctional phosphoglucose/phosphomannose isomerase [Candidatus Saccharimonadales bacterium]